MTSLIFWLWGPCLLLAVAGLGLYLNRRNRMHPGE